MSTPLKYQVYFFPGLAAGPLIFERITLDPDQFETHYLEWKTPEKKQSLSDYVQSYCQEITGENLVFIGVSFGGIIMQELAQYFPKAKVIIISSIKSPQELPPLYQWAGKYRINRLVPIHIFQHIETYAWFLFHKSIPKSKKSLYQKYLPMRDSHYLRWSLREILTWKGCRHNPRLIHIHGDCDEIFPIKYIRNSHVVKDGTHAMILNRFRWFNEHLPVLIQNL